MAGLSQAPGRRQSPDPKWRPPSRRACGGGLLHKLGSWLRSLMERATLWAGTAVQGPGAPPLDQPLCHSQSLRAPLGSTRSRPLPSAAWPSVSPGRRLGLQAWVQALGFRCSVTLAGLSTTLRLSFSTLQAGGQDSFLLPCSLQTCRPDPYSHSYRRPVPERPAGALSGAGGAGAVDRTLGWLEALRRGGFGAEEGIREGLASGTGRRAWRGHGPLCSWAPRAEWVGAESFKNCNRAGWRTLFCVQKCVYTKKEPKKVSTTAPLCHGGNQTPKSPATRRSENRGNRLGSDGCNRLKPCS